MLVRTGRAIAAGAVGFPLVSTIKARDVHSDKFGAVAGNAAGAKAGERVLADGGNAIDAAVAAALVAGVASPHLTGSGGYGGHMIIALAGGKGVACIDFNTAAPAAATPDMFYPCDEKGEAKGQINRYGWMASGVPGVLAGMQLALEKHGTRSFAEMAQPAIQMAREGAPLDLICALAIFNSAARLAKDPGSKKLYLTNGDSPKAGAVLRNPDLAEMLSTLAARNSTDSFYRGDIAQHIADTFQKNGGLVTARDLAAYRARDVKPLQWKGHGFKVLTAPLGAGGLTVLEGLSVLDAMQWDSLPASPAKTHALVEALRLVWKDRLECLGDPAMANVPVNELFSQARARALAAQADEAARSGKAMKLKIGNSRGPGTVNISSVDSRGNVVAVTLTHGGDFGAQVTVPGLGLTLGQGMYKFNPHPDSPNAPGPGKHPLHNMCPSLVLGANKTVLSVGGAGSQIIPNAVFSFLLYYMFQNSSIADALAAPRIHTTGTLDVTAEEHWPQADIEYLKQAGFKVRTAPCAHLSSAFFNAATGECSAGMR